ncbi:MAG: TRAP transporter substrate-binding protein [Rhodospirillales bacterium]|nr:MAG: TRAP transporter substrate-binding protein [Rhodospirillales bacterium]
MFRAIALALVGLTLFAMTPARAQTTILTVSTWVPPGHPINTIMLPAWFKQVEEATQGRVKFRVLPKVAGAVGGQIDAIRDGLADIGYTPHGYNPGRFVLQELAELPLLGETSLESSIAYWRIFQKHLAKFNEHEGVTVLSVMVSEGRLHNARREITSVRDLNGLKIRVAGGNTVETAKLLGIVPVQKPINEIFEMLTSGIVDGAMMPMVTVQSFGLLDKLTHTLVVPGALYNSSYSLFANPAKFSKLSPEDQEAIRKVSGENFARIWGATARDGDAKAEAEARRLGNKVTNISPAFEAELRKALEPIDRLWIDRAKAKGMADAEEILKEFRAEARQASAVR